jgi:hypothetical protein
MLWVSRIVTGLIVIAVALFLAASVFLSIRKDAFFNLYAYRLDQWVNAGGNVKTVDAEVVPSCGKLAMTQWGAWQDIRFLTVDRGEFDFEVDVCVKLTVNRLYKQPEFEKPEIVKMVCAGTNDLYRRLCQRAGLTPSS